MFNLQMSENRVESALDDSKNSPKTLDRGELLLKDNPDRFVLFPIQYHDIWEAYKKQEAVFWTAEEIDFGKDLNHWERLNDDERHFIKNIFIYFEHFYFSAFRTVFKGSSKHSFLEMFFLSNNSLKSFQCLSKLSLIISNVIFG